MLSGRQYDTYIEALGEFVDLSTWFASNDERWRKYPVINWVVHYYKMTLSKLTENVPSIGYLPATPDELDARLAQVMEPIFKSAWRRMGMPELMYDLHGWLITAGRGILAVNWNPDIGPAQEWTGPAIVHMLGPDGGIQTRVISNAPFIAAPDGRVLPNIQNPVIGESGDVLFHPDTGMPIAHPGADNMPSFGRPQRKNLGDLEATVISPVSIIVPHGPEPFFRKRWYCHEFLMHVDQIQQKYGLDQTPDVHFKGKDQIIFKVDYGTNFGMPSLNYGGTGGLGRVHDVAVEDLAVVRALWNREDPNDPDLERGRLTVVTHDQVLYDDINPYWVDGTNEHAVIPFHAFDLIKFPFRQEGHTDLEIVNPLNRAFNRRFGGLMDAVDFNEQPIRVRDPNAGWDESADEMNQPGAVIDARFLPNGQPPMAYINPPPLPAAGVEMAKQIQELMQLLGSQPLGSEGIPMTSDPSGELQRQLRFDTDRVWGATVRKHSYDWARVAETIKHIMAACLTDDRMLTMSGEDNGYDFIAVKPEMFTGEIHAVAQPESAVLESRQDKQNRITNLVANGIIPPQIAAEAMNYPDLTRLMRPGGAAYSMAERENMEMVLGVASPVLPEHDHQTHLLVHLKRMQTIEYRNATPDVQARFRLHVALHKQLAVQQMIADTAAQAPAVMAGAAMHKSVQEAATPDSETGDSPGGADPRPRRLAISR